MNMANTNYQDHDFDYQADYRRTTKSKPSNKRNSFSYSRSNRAAVSHNGIHRRRNKRFAW